MAGGAVARAGLRPVARLTEAAERVARTDDLRPIPVFGSDELARLTEAFNMMLRALAESRERQARLVTDAGHELRTPLTSLRTKVNIYMYRYGKVLDVFRTDHPDIQPFLLTGTGAQITTKILSERRAGRYLADVIGLGSSNYRILHQQAKMLDPIQPALMLPEVLDASRWYGGKHRYLDPDGKYVFAYLANASSGQLYYNTALVNPKEFTSYYDLFKPRWKGKITALDPRPRTEIGTTMQFFYYHPELGPSFIRQLFGGKEITFQPRLEADDRLACAREVRHMLRLLRGAQGEKPGIAHRDL